MPFGGQGAQEAVCTAGDRDAVLGALYRDDCTSTATQAAEEACEALLLKDKGGIEVTTLTNFGTLKEGGSRSLVICLE